MSEIKLLQCPFCGGKMKIVDVSESMPHTGRYIFRCENSCIKSHSFMTEQEAVRACNTRKPMERIVEQLEEYSSGDFCDRFRGGCPYVDNPDIHCENCAVMGAIEIVKAGGAV